MNLENPLKTALRITLVATPLLACCCPAIPIAREQTDEVIQVEARSHENLTIEHNNDKASNPHSDDKASANILPIVRQKAGQNGRDLPLTTTQP